MLLLLFVLFYKIFNLLVKLFFSNAKNDQIVLYCTVDVALEMFVIVDQFRMFRIVGW